MTSTRPAGRLRRPIGRLVGRLIDRLRRGEDGSILLESIIAISLITFIMSAVGAEYVSGLQATNTGRLETSAVQLADSAVENLRALHVSDLLSGRSLASVTSEFNTLSAIPAVRGYLTTSVSNLAFDILASVKSLLVPTTALLQTLNGTGYNVYNYLECTSGANSVGGCISSLTSRNLVRAVVAVTWAQNGCPKVTLPGATSAVPTCSYTTTTLLDADPDPTFDLNQNLPPAPIVSDPGAQTVAVGDTVSQQLGVQTATGVAPFSWALNTGSLPSGLTISPAGLISGTVSGSPGSASSTIVVTDGFLRTASVTIAWTIKPRLAFNAVADQANLTGDTISLTVGATGGSGSGYVFTDPSATLPTGFVISPAGVVSGVATSADLGTTAVQLRVVDSAGRTATTRFQWTVTTPPISISNPVPQTSTIGAADTLQLSASGGDGRFVWSASGLPAGLGIDFTGKISGTPTQVNSPQGTTATITVSDPTAGVPAKQQTVSWIVFAAPTIATPAAQFGTKGAPTSLSVPATTCPNSPCTYALTGQPSGLAINATTGAISGTIATGAVSSSSVAVIVTDASGASVSTGAFAWTVYNPATLSGLTTHAATEGVLDNVPITYTCSYTPCRITLANAFPGIGLEATASKSGDNSADTSIAVSATTGIVYLTGTVLSTAVTGTATSKSYSVSLTVTDGGGYQPTASTATWTAWTPPTVTGLTSASFAAGSSASQSFSYTCATSTCSIALTAPSGLTLDTNNKGSGVTSPYTVSTASGILYVRGTMPTTKGANSVALKITDGNGFAVTLSATWTAT